MADPVVECSNVRMDYSVRRGMQDHAVVALDDVSISILPGRTLGVVGESGSGKSTLARVACALTVPTGGEVRFGGRPLVAMNRTERRALRRRVQIVWQDALASMNTRDTIEMIVTEAPICHGLFPASERHSRAVTILESVGLPAEIASKRPSQLSGGQLQRIAIARAIALEPELLVCDEITSALDISVQAQILNLLHEVQSRTSVAYLFISHDLHVVRHISDNVVVMHAGRIVETGPSSAIYDRPQHPYTTELVRLAHSELVAGAGDAETTISAERPSQGCLYRSVCPLSEAVCSSVRPPLADRPTGTSAACHATMPSKSPGRAVQ